MSTPATGATSAPRLRCWSPPGCPRTRCSPTSRPAATSGPTGACRALRAIGDALAPGTIAAAVWEGRRFAEEIENPSDDADATPYRREVTQLAAQQE